jgi:hypothetical protein
MSSGEYIAKHLPMFLGGSLKTEPIYSSILVTPTGADLPDAGICRSELGRGLSTIFRGFCKTLDCQPKLNPKLAGIGMISRGLSRHGILGFRRKADCLTRETTQGKRSACPFHIGFMGNEGVPSKNL